MEGGGRGGQGVRAFQVAEGSSEDDREKGKMIGGLEGEVGAGGAAQWHSVVGFYFCLMVVVGIFGDIVVKSSDRQRREDMKSLLWKY